MAHETWSLLSLHVSHSASSTIVTISAGNLYYQHKSRKQLVFSMKTSSHSVPHTRFAIRTNSQAENIKVSKRFEGNALKNKFAFWVCHSRSLLVQLAGISAFTRDTNLDKMKQWKYPDATWSHCSCLWRAVTHGLHWKVFPPLPKRLVLAAQCSSWQPAGRCAV